MEDFRNFKLSTACTSELLKALLASTDAASAPSPPSFSPNQWDHGPRPGPTLEPKPKSEFERIIALAEWAPPPGGWPPRDPNQSSLTHKDTDYIHTNSRGGPDGGYYTFPGYAERSARPLPHDNPAKFSAEDKMTMQYIQSSGKDTRAPYAALSDHLSAADIAELGQMFGSSGSALLYNPYAGSMMAALANGLSVAEAKASLALYAQAETSAGSKESIAQLDDAWFALAAATVARFA